MKKKVRLVLVGAASLALAALLAVACLALAG